MKTMKVVSVSRDGITVDYVNKFLDNNKGWVYENPPSIGNHLISRTLVVLKDGTCMSIQASRYHYCEPRDNNGPYTHVEIGFPSRSMPELLEFAEDRDNPTDTVYSYVPVDVLNEVIKKAGGRVNSRDLAKAYNERNDLKQQRDDLLAELIEAKKLIDNYVDAHQGDYGFTDETAAYNAMVRFNPKSIAPAQGRK